MDSTCVNPKDLKDFEAKLNNDISGKKIAIIDNFLKEQKWLCQGIMLR